METTQTQTPAQAALSALESRAQNGEKVTPKELAEARAALDLEGFERAATERAEGARSAAQRAQSIADLDAQVSALDADKSLDAARRKLRAALDTFGRACGEYEARRLELSDAISAVSPVEGDETLPALWERWKAVERARMRSAVFVTARDALTTYFPRVPVEFAEWSD